MLTIKNLRVDVGGKEVLKGVDLRIQSGEIHAIMGPNGAGKTSLAMSLAGHPSYKFKVISSKLRINDEDMLSLKPEERARKGLFVAFQNPIEVNGVSVISFLRTAQDTLSTQKIPLVQFKEEVKEALGRVGLSEDFMHRGLNEGFSGGEKKRMEIVQLLILKPRFAVLDEIDSGLDIDSLRSVAKAISYATKQYKLGILLITHYQRILHHLKPHHVHILIDGRIKKSDGMGLVRKIERNGYAAI